MFNVNNRTDYTYNATNMLIFILQIIVQNVNLLCLVGRYKCRIKQQVTASADLQYSPAALCSFTVQYDHMVNLNSHKNTVHTLTEL
jgi:hypothetical protein